MAPENLETRHESELELGRRMKVGCVPHVALFLLVLFGTDIYADHPAVTLALGGLIVIANIIRFLLAVTQPKFYPAKREVWLLSFSVLLIATGLGWGLLTFAAVHYYGLVSQATSVLFLVASGVCAAATTSLTPSRRHAILFISLIFPLPIIEATMFWSWQGATFAMIFALYYAFLIAQISLQNREYLLGIQSRQQIVNDKERVEEATRVKSEFLANMSHELRTPLNGIIGLTGLLEETPMDSQQLDLVRTVKNCGNMLLAIINDILDFSKIEAGKLSIENESYSLKACLENCANLVSYKANEKKLSVNVEVDASVPEFIKGDSGRLSQVVLNLLGNALKFTEIGGVSVTASATAQADGSFEITVRVKDTGIGIPEERRNRLFQSFSQVDASTSRKYGGTGLGLAISKMLAELMGGRIWVESEHGRGSTFAFTIDAVAAERPVEENRSSAVTETTATGVSVGIVAALPTMRSEPKAPAAVGVGSYGLRVLAVDDNSTNLTLATKLLEKMGCSSETARDGRAAVAAVEREHFDLVLMDVQMPEMSGLEATEVIRASRELRQPRIVALTANSHAEDRARCLKAGMNDYLAKPLRVADLHRVLSEAAASKSGRAA